MIPPVDPSILSSNPKFSALYSDLCNNKLNSDGTSKLDAKAQRDRDTLDEELRKSRIQGARRDLIKDGLHDISYRADELPENLRQLVAVVVALLEGQIADEDRYLLQEDMTKFTSNVNKVNAALSDKLHRDATALASMLDPDNSVAIEHLPATIAQLKSSISTSSTELERHRLSLADEAVQLHTLYRQVISSSIHLLEQVLHGSVSRATKARAEYLALVAEGMDKKLRLQHAQLQSVLFSPEVLAALEAKMTTLRTERNAVKKQIGDLEGALEGYARIGGMEKLAREYALVLDEIEMARGDIERLEDVE